MLVVPWLGRLRLSRDPLHDHQGLGLSVRGVAAARAAALRGSRAVQGRGRALYTSGVGDLRYADAGVDIDEGGRAVELIRRTVASTQGPQVLAPIGSFGGLFAPDLSGYSQPVLVSSTDSVGTKVKVAIATGRHRSIGMDLVNHCINDIACCGAEPLFFLDYFATGRLRPEQLAEIVEGLAEACRNAGCAIVGGETAEMPGVYAIGDYDIAGFIVGMVDRARIIDGSAVKEGDLLLGMPSSGLHTNGYSLVRHIVEQREIGWEDVLPGTDAPLAELLLAPHRSYLDAIRDLRGRCDLRALAHITGGGLQENVPRALPEGLAAEIDRGTWQVPPVMRAIGELGPIHPDEMWRTFNMGIGMVAVVPEEQADGLTEAAGVPLIRIGRVVQRSGPDRVRWR
jgi:phosphoribosylformylglycinamidine cyclo-ligase